MTDIRADRALPGCGPRLYAQWRSTNIGTITDHLEQALILELAGNVAGLRVLDIGCGDGELTLRLWERGAQITGIDASPEMIEAARARAKNRQAPVAFEVAAAEQLPFESERFDVVVAITILCFVPNAAPVFREIARVLRPSGRLVIGELGRWSSWAMARRIRAWCGSALWRRARFRSQRELRSLTENAGLAVETVRGAIYYPRWRFAARLCAGWDPVLGRLTTIGAAFITLAAVKPRVRTTLSGVRATDQIPIRDRDAGIRGARSQGILQLASAISLDRAPAFPEGAVSRCGRGSKH
jgi:ubiquinone biosynthesis O-methyltransferase